MKKIPFDVKYRPEIESGKYKVQTTDGRNVRIICWDKRVYGGRYEIVALVPTEQGDTESCQMYNPDGSLIASTWNEKFKLVILTEKTELTEFEMDLRRCIVEHLTTHIKDGNGREMSSTVFIGDETAKKMAEELLELAKKELESEEGKALLYVNEKAYKIGFRDGKIEGYEKAMKEFKELPALTWPPTPIQTYFPPCYYGGPCTNPHHDCINCPQQYTTGIITTTLGTSTSKAEGQK